MKKFNNDFTGSFRKVVWESGLDVEDMAGGCQLDPASLTRFSSLGYVPAGTVVSDIDQVTGYHKAVTITSGNPDTYDVVPFGMVVNDTPIEDFTLVNIRLMGTCRIDALPDKEKAGVAGLMKALPKITFKR